MDWTEDATVMANFDLLMETQRIPLSQFLETILPYSEQTPIWGILMLYGKFVMRYCDLRDAETENDAYNQAVADLANDPLVGQLVASVMGSTIDRKVGFE